ncbi:SprB repeat-containing protein, partial [Roseivirga sp. E12]|uniref:beta strand repeat-containing protein n=1 Tax=Roseivirga sp. E12 TaxID=2819237 RepID=UPI001ABCD443
MPVTTNKRYYLRIILLLILFSCTAKQVFSAEEEEQAGPVISSVSINSCVGSITISVTSGVLPYSYEWKDSGGTTLPFTSFIASGLTAGNYTVEVTDGNGDSTGPATYTVTNPPDLVGTVVVNDVTCRGDSDAQIVVTMGNGNPGYDWELFDGGMSSIGTGSIAFPNNVITITGLGIGNYTLRTADQDGCTGDIVFTVTQPANFLGYSIGSSTDATCFNSSDGSITATGTGGWGAYTYQWVRLSDNAVIGTAATITGLAAGDYRLDIIDRSGTGCTISTPTLTINSPPEIIPTASISNALCNGDANGAIDLSVAGGVAPYTYSWSNGATSQDISGLTAGNYTVTITDNAGCTDVETFTVTEPGVLTINPVITDVDCFGDNTGRIQSNVSGGTGPYTYAWSTGNSGTNLNNRVAGTYSLTVTDANGCVATAVGLTVSQPVMALSKLSDVQTDPACFGNSDGSITITMQGGTGPYSYLWSNGDNTTTATGLNAGIHSVTVTDANGCTYFEAFTLTDPARIAVAPVLTLPTCNGGADGAITVSASNGTGPYIYNWNTGDSGPTITGLVAGTYTVTVSDAGGCSVMENIVLGEPAILVGNATVNNISCNGSADGSVFLGVSGGTAPYTYAWNTGATTNNITGLAAGGYSVTITDAAGCAIVENYTIIDPAPIGVAFTQTNILCKGATTGGIDITPSGGTAPYSYLWSNGATTQDLTNVAAGNYSVTVRDASSCTTVLNVTITEPALVLNLSGTETNATCNGSNNGSIDVTVTGGAGPYSYSWNTGAITEDITGLAPGNYSVSVTDANGCIKSIGFTITEPAPLAASPSKTDITCNAANDGTISVAVSGGTGPYTYSWADDGSITSNTRTGLTPGNYTVTVIDANGCMDVESITIIEPAQLASSDVVQNVSCFGESTGAINLSISGGVAPYSFLWSNGALTEDLVNIPAGNYSVVITDVNGCTINDNFTITQPSSALSKTEAVQQITCNGAADGIINLTVTGGSAPYTYNWSNGSTSEDLNSLPAGSYSVTITDNNGCTINDTYVITDPPVLVLAGTKTDVSCFGADDGTVDITVSGGEAPYTYAWSNGETTEDVTGLAPGNYTVNITDARGCTTNQAFNIVEPAVLSIGHSLNNVSCFGLADGAIDITVSGGSAPYTYAWSNASNSEDISGLTAGDYTITVTDVNGCSLVETITVTQPLAALSTAAVVTDIGCFGGSDGSIQLTPAGGTAPYSYSWNTGSTSKDIFGLSDGSYQVTITDANGCSIVENYTIAMPAALQSSGTQVNVLCNGDNTGSIDLTVTGGTGAYTYTWSNGVTTEDLNNVVAGSYTVTIADARGCSINRAFTITQPLALNVVDNVVDVACFGDGDGSIDISVSGGIAPYTYSWSGGGTTQDLFNLTGGSYTLTVTDANGCQSVNTYTVNEPTAALAVSGVVTDENCFGDSQGAVQLTVTGGSAPYSYSWNQGSTTKDVSGLGRGT